jgi:protein tyrosine/serine phosphatase
MPCVVAPSNEAACGLVGVVKMPSLLEAASRLKNEGVVFAALHSGESSTSDSNESLH